MRDGMIGNSLKTSVSHFLKFHVSFCRIHLLVIREFKTYNATVAKTSLKIASSSFSIDFTIMSVCLTFESYRNYPGTVFRGAVSTLEKNIQICA